MKEIKDHIDEVHRNPLLCEDSSSESESSDESEVTDNAREVQLKKAKMVQVPLKIDSNVKYVLMHSQERIMYPVI